MKMEAVVWVREAFTGRASEARRPHGSVVRDLLSPQASALLSDFYVKCNGRVVGLDEELQDGLAYSVEPRLCGGKGGFGSMLRALGAQIEKTTNREACRDLSGRRLRDVNHEKAMAEWVKKQAEREAEKEQRRLERLKRKLAEPKHYFTDPEYHRQCEDMAEHLEDSVIKGLQASSSTSVSPTGMESRKRKAKEESSKSKFDKKKCFWTGVEGLDISSGSDSGSDSDGESPSTSSQSTAPKPFSSDSQNDSDGSETHLAPNETSHSIQEQKEAGSPLQEGSKEQTSDPEQVKEAGSPLLEGSKEQTSDPDQVKEAGSPLLEGSKEQTSDPEQVKEAGSPLQEGSKEQISDPEQVKEAGSSLQEGSNEQISDPEQVKEAGSSLQEASDPEQVTHPAEATMPESQGPEKEKDKPALEIQNMDSSPVDLLAFSSADELEALGLERLKQELMSLGLKCGGTLQERAARLFSVRGLSKEQIDPSLFAKPTKGKRK